MNSSISVAGQREALDRLYHQSAEKCGFMGRVYLWFKSLTMAGKCDIAAKELYTQMVEGLRSLHQSSTGQYHTFKELDKIMNQDIPNLIGLFSSVNRTLVNKMYEQIQGELDQKVMNCFQSSLPPVQALENFQICQRYITLMMAHESFGGKAHFDQEISNNIGLESIADASQFFQRKISDLEKEYQFVLDLHDTFLDPDPTKNPNATALLLQGRSFEKSLDVSGFHLLKNLNLQQAEIFDAPDLRSCSKLESVDLSGTFISDAPDVTGLAHLMFLSLERTYLTELPDSILYLSDRCKVNVRGCTFPAGYREDFEERLAQHRKAHPGQGPMIQWDYAHD